MTGLYPNLAVADEGNLQRLPTQHAFHTAVKRGVLLHPTSVFTFKPELVLPRRGLYTKGAAVDRFARCAP